MILGVSAKGGKRNVFEFDGKLGVCSDLRRVEISESHSRAELEDQCVSLFEAMIGRA